MEMLNKLFPFLNSAQPESEITAYRQLADREQLLEKYREHSTDEQKERHQQFVEKVALMRAKGQPLRSLDLARLRARLHRMGNRSSEDSHYTVKEVA
ncbi:hypothetical protein [Motiliproteus sp. MSK22-1]|uniref:hypothetical protein n=1 Tax=Motiliproteus sp. MSK22-1 TaxID=1897630 RepID=UPI00097630A1|nr:hypothetical protein [Motiliproteus sp. MSK22-1]OMH38187.1 hypothetical protein BGP75_07985 [Motiliproteus sp. MSK22-1]